jgi:F-type H+-transporting ATPase subunit b
MSETHSIVSAATLIPPAINFVILVGFLAYKGRKPVLDFVSTRHAFIRDELVRVSSQLKGAQEKYEEFSSKLKAIDAEARALKEQVKQDSEAARNRILSEANRFSTTLISDAQTSAQALYTEVRNQLRYDLGLRVLAQAEQNIKARLTDADQTRIRHDFSKQVELMP